MPYSCKFLPLIFLLAMNLLDGFILHPHFCNNNFFFGLGHNVHLPNNSLVPLFTIVLAFICVTMLMSPIVIYSCWYYFLLWYLFLRFCCYYFCYVLVLPLIFCVIFILFHCWSHIAYFIIFFTVSDLIALVCGIFFFRHLCDFWCITRY